MTAQREFPSRVHVLMLVAAIIVCAAVRLWLIDRTVIADDGTVYLQMAHQWTSSPMEVIKDYDYPPGYPVATVGVHRLLVILGLADRHELWDLAGRLVSFVSNLAAVVAIWVIAGTVIDWRTAAITTLLFGVSKKWAHLGANVISDSLAICLQLWATVLLLKTLPLLRRRSRWALPAAACVGMLTGLGYLVRPESLWIAPIAATVWLGRAIIRRTGIGMTLASIVVMGAGIVVIGGPYMMTIRGLSNKQSVHRIVSHWQNTNACGATAAPATAPAADNAVPLTRKPPPIKAGLGPISKKISAQFSEAIHPVLWSFGVAWVIGLGVKLLIRTRIAASLPLPMPDNAGKAVMVAAAIIIVPTLAALYVTAGYLSHRHITYLVVLLSPLTAAGLVFLIGVALLILRLIRVPAKCFPWVTRVLVAAAFAGLAYDTIRQPDRGEAYIRQAGLYINGIAGKDDILLADDSRTAYYADIEYRRFDWGEVTAAGLRKMIEQDRPPVTLVVFSEKEMVQTARDEPGLAGFHQDRRLEKLKEFSRGGKRPDRIIVYRVNQSASMPGR